jgi:hypothetical protein
MSTQRQPLAMQSSTNNDPVQKQGEKSQENKTINPYN